MTGDPRADVTLLDELEAARAAATPIPGAPDYGVTPDGRVWSLNSNWRGYGPRPLVPAPDKYGYMKVRLTSDSGRRKRFVHVLVLSTLGAQRPSEDHQVRHLNGDKTDNQLINLAWGTAAENAADRDAHGTTARGARNGWSRYSQETVADVLARHRAGERQCDIGRALGLSGSSVRGIVRHHGRTIRAVLTAPLGHGDTEEEGR